MKAAIIMKEEIGQHLELEIVAMTAAINHHTSQGIIVLDIVTNMIQFAADYHV
jgi:hypothetical protein